MKIELVGLDPRQPFEYNIVPGSLPAHGIGVAMAAVILKLFSEAANDDWPPPPSYA